jgi:hypothetical protein
MKSRQGASSLNTAFAWYAVCVVTYEYWSTIASAMFVTVWIERWVFDLLASRCQPRRGGETAGATVGILTAPDLSAAIPASALQITRAATRSYEINPLRIASTIACVRFAAPSFLIDDLM